MLPALTKQGGQAFAAPDVCKTQVGPATTPIPYPNTAMLAQATKESQKVKICNKPALVVKSEVPKSSGDEPGSLGGVVSNRNMDKVKFAKGSNSVKFEGSPAVYLTAMTQHNGSNANMPSGSVIAPSQTKVLIGP